jgi:CheY-like chemotaxis protein
MRILYVEDNLANLALVQRLARIGNHEIISHPDGETALARFQQDKPDLVLMDIQLKGVLNGLEVVTKLRERGYETPIIALTAYAMVGDRDRCLQAGCNEYLPKPLPIEQLVEFFERFDPKNTAPDLAQKPPTSDVLKSVQVGADGPSEGALRLPAAAGQMIAAAPLTPHPPVTNGNPNPLVPEIRPIAATGPDETSAGQPTPNSAGASDTVGKAAESTSETTSQATETDAASLSAPPNTDEPSSASRNQPAAPEASSPPG